MEMKLVFAKDPIGWTVIDESQYDGPESTAIGSGDTRGEALMDLISSMDPDMYRDIGGYFGDAYIGNFIDV